MEILISEIVARNLYGDVNDVVQRAFTVLTRGNILRKTEYSINPQMTRTELVPPNKTKLTTNDMHRKRSDFLVCWSLQSFAAIALKTKKL